MEFLTDYLLDIHVTDVEHMRTTNTKQHDNFSRQVSTFEKLLMFAQSNINTSNHYNKLKLVLRDGAKNRGMLKINSFPSLEEALNTYSENAESEDVQEEVTKHFDSFTKQVEQMRKMKDFFHETIYHPLYEFFYHPLDEISDDEDMQSEEELSGDDNDDNDDKSDKSDKSDVDIGERDLHRTPTPPVTPQPKPTSDHLSVPSKPKKKKKKMNKDSVKSGKKKKKKKDNRLKVLERIQKEKAEKAALVADQHFEEPPLGLAFNKLKKKTDRQKLAFAVRLMFSTYQSWESMLQSGAISLAHFDPDSAFHLKDYKNYAPFEALLRLIPDMVVKGYKLVDCAKIWYNCSRRLIGPREVECSRINRFFDLIDVKEKTIQNLEKEIETKSEMRLSKISERKLIMNKILRSNKIKEDYEQSVEKEEELKDYYKQLKNERNAEYPILERLERDDRKYKQTYDNIQYLAEQMASVYRELQTTSYEMEMLRQDYNIEVESRSNLIRLRDDVTYCIQDLQISIPIHEKQQADCRKDITIMRDNLERMWLALYYPSTDERLTMRADNFFNLRYPINNSSSQTNNNRAKQAAPSSALKLEEATMDNAIDQQLDNAEKDHIKLLEKLQRADKLKNGFNPSAAGLTDPIEAEDYKLRVERLKKGFNLDLSDLKTELDFEVTPREAPPEPIVKASSQAKQTQSGDDADQESDDNHQHAASKKPSRRWDERNVSPLSDASDDITFSSIRHRPEPPRSPKTVYILKRSEPKQPPKVQYIHKTHPKIHLPTIHSDHNEIFKQKNPYYQYKKKERPDAYNSADSGKFIDTLSIYKPSRSGKGSHTNAQPPALPLEHATGVFTPMNELTDGDISEDSGTGESLNSKSDGDQPKTQITSEYKHKPRWNESLSKTKSKIPKPKVAFLQSPSSTDSQLMMAAASNSKIPRRRSKSRKKNNEMSPILQTPSPVSPPPSDRHTLSIRKPIFTKPERIKPPVKIPSKTQNPRQHPKLPNQVSPTYKSLIAKKHHPAKALEPTKQPVATRKPQKVKPKRPAPVLPVYRNLRRFNNIDDVSDEDDELFKSVTVKSNLPPKPTIRATLVPPKHNRRAGMSRVY